MLLRIQKDESLRSYVERNLFVLNTFLDNDAAEIFSRCNWSSSQVKLIADLLGWHGCYGFNKLLHQHTAHPWKVALKSRFNHSYSDDAYLTKQENFDSLSKVRAYCPVCAKEDKKNLGYSYWRRLHPDVQVCAKHNVVLLTTCQFCNRPFARGGHAVSVMWAGCAGRHLGEAQPLVNVDLSALRLAQFFDELCRVDEHIYIDTAAAVIEERIIKNYESNHGALGELESLTEFRCYIERWRLNDPCVSWKYYSLSNKLIKLAISLYESFDEFLHDCHKLQPNAPSISYFWDTYCCFSSYTQNFVREVYELGVAEWSWPAFVHLSRNLPHRNSFPMMWSSESDLCCIQSDKHPPRNHYDAPYPRVRRLTQDELVAMTEMPIAG
jgi:hypothetical protein